VCDPACGSGHFLVAAARRIAKRLATVRTGDNEPSPEATRSALRDVVGRCLYGVDINPMAVELCKVSLWMEALDPGKPLSFLDAHIKCGNALLGTTAALIAGGIPDDAFTPLSGDDKDVAREWRKRNMREREGQLAFEDESIDLVGGLEALATAFGAASDDTVVALHEKETLFHDLISSAPYARAKVAADAWCAAFVQRKMGVAPGITTGVVHRLATGTGEVSGDVRDGVGRLAEEFGFFQWEVEFPEVFTCQGGGFACVLGNPPWDQVQFREQEFFAGRNDEIADAANSSIRRALIQGLAVDDPTLFEAYLHEAYRVEAFRHFATGSSRFPLTGGGRVNLFGLFAESFDALMGVGARAGAILSSGIATDDTCKEFFAALMKEGRLYELLDFENRRRIFPTVHSAAKFCLLVFAALRLPGAPRFTFYATDVREARDESNRIPLSYEQVLLVNPTTKTCPIFRSTREAGLVISAYERFPAFSAGWKLKTKPGLFNMAGHSGEFVGSASAEYVPLFEGKMVGLYDHRAADVVISKTAQIRQGQSAALSEEEHGSPDRLAKPRYWVTAAEVERRLIDQWDRKWLLGWKEVTSPTNERTLIGALLPAVGVGHKIHLVIVEGGADLAPCLLATINSFVCDFVCRCKLGGTSLTPFVVKQLPVPTSELFVRAAPFDRGHPIDRWINPRVVELIYTAVDMREFGRDFDSPTEPFVWDPDRRFALRCELDAAFFHLYGLNEGDVDYVMDTFPIVKRRDEENHGHYRTKALILDVYRKMADSIAAGVPYETILDPPPADPRVAHAPRSTAAVP
jgi:hypothetical protein